MNLLNIQSITVVLIILLFALFNGLIVNWKQATDEDKAKSISKQWHAVAMVIRALVVLLFYSNITLMIILGWFSIISYDIIIALIMRQKWYYIGDTATIDKLGTKINYGLRILLTVGMIIYLILN